MRAIGEIVEYRATISSDGALRSLAVEVELEPSTPSPAALSAQIGRRLRDALGLTVPVTPVAAGSLPRFEMKARRCVVVP